MPVDRTPRWYFSLRSPYSWLAHHDLCTRYPDVAGRIVWRPFWEPDETGERDLLAAGGEFPYVPMTRAKSRYLLRDVRRLARQRGLEPAWPVDTAPVWEVAHLAYLLAADAGAGQAFVAAVYQARWLEGRDISDPAVVRELATGLGLPEALADAANDPGIRERGTSCLLAADRDGVFGVPFFAVGHERFWGVDRLPEFVAAVREQPAWALPEPPDEVLAPAADLGHAGGCG
ncbi:2-hydroxychromene-2-carboxylate isomerase [Kibdelosporangium lantanae]